MMCLRDMSSDKMECNWLTCNCQVGSLSARLKLVEIIVAYFRGTIACNL